MTVISRLRACLSLAAALAIIAAALAQTPQPAIRPSLGCEVARVGDAPPSGTPIRVSNLKRVLMRATLVAPASSVEPLRLAAMASDASPATLDVIVQRAAESVRSRVEGRAVAAGQGIEPGRQYVDVALEIPVDRATRRAQIERYLERLAQASARGGRSDEFKRLTQNRETAIATFERMYVDNAVGDFEVTCAYSARRPGVWNGTIESSPPIRLHVFFESAFFDQPAFR